MTRLRNLQRMNQLLGSSDLVTRLEELDVIYLFNLEICSVVLGFSQTWYACLLYVASIRRSLYLTITPSLIVIV